jgi:hypothetical protein
MNKRLPKPTKTSKPADRCSNTTQVRAWFDPTGKALVALCARVSQGAVDELEGYNRLEGFLGIHPECIVEVMSWARLDNGDWCKLGLGEALNRANGLLVDLLMGGITVWHARCSGMDYWWHSDAGRKHWSAMGAAFSASAMKRKAKSLAKQAAQFEKDRATVKAKSNEQQSDATDTITQDSTIQVRKSTRKKEHPNMHHPDHVSQCAIIDDLEELEAGMEADAKWSELGELKLRWY